MLVDVAKFSSVCPGGRGMLAEDRCRHAFEFKRDHPIRVRLKG